MATRTAQAIAQRGRGAPINEQLQTQAEQREKQGKTKPAVGLPGASPSGAGAAAEKEGREKGLRGKELRDYVRQAREGAKGSQSAAAEAALDMPEGSLKYVKNPRKFMRRVLGGKGPAMKRLMMLKPASRDLGYEKDIETERGYVGQQYDPETGAPIVNYHEEVTPQGTAWAETVGKHYDPATGETTGMSEREKAAFFAEQADPLRAQAQQQYASEGERLAAAGVDPRSGVAAGRAASIGAATQRGLAEAGRQTQLEDIKRKQDWEKYAGDIAALQEKERGTDVSADLTKSGQIQTGLSDLATRTEGQRQFDVTYTEGQRQAQQSREDAKRAAEAAKPSTLEMVGAGFGGLASGLTGK